MLKLEGGHQGKQKAPMKGQSLVKFSRLAAYVSDAPTWHRNFHFNESVPVVREGVMKVRPSVTENDKRSLVQRTVGNDWLVKWRAAAQKEFNSRKKKQKKNRSSLGL